MKTELSIPDLLERVTAADGSRILRELQRELDQVIARHQLEIQKSKPAPKKSAKKRVS